MQSTITIDDFGPLPLHRPDTAAAVGEFVRQAAGQGQAVYPVGGRTMLDFGLPPTKPGLALDLTALDQVIDYPARDMTITVQAGITVAKLQALLATENQQLPIDVPHPEQATLGGAIATNASGPRRYGYGTLRDYVIGITVVNDEGQEVKAGGRVVKNVAGYDLCKLYTGSLGTLGIITQVTLKVRPLPEAVALLFAGCSGDALADLLNRLHTSATRPSCIEVTWPAAPIKADFHVAVGFEGSKQAVEWQVTQLQDELQHHDAFLARTGADAKRDFQVLSEQRLTRSAFAISYKANLLPSGIPVFLRTAQGNLVAGLTADAGSGIVIGSHHGDLTLAQAKPMLTSLLDAAAAAQGNVVVLRCPPAWKRELPIWGRPRGDGELMRAVKEKLDPRRLFNPGRFVEGM